MERNVSGLSRRSQNTLIFAIFVSLCSTPCSADSFTNQSAITSLPVVVSVGIRTNSGVEYVHCFSGTVSRVIDGDTIIVATNPADSNAVRRTCRVRLAEIDAPELKTEFGPIAKQALADMITGKTATVKWTHRGRYGRIIGVVSVGNRNICHYLVANGFARRYAWTPKRSVVAALETKAREDGRGLWGLTAE